MESIFKEIMKKTTAILLSVLLLAFALTGCGGSGNAEAEPPATEAPTEPETEAPTEDPNEEAYQQLNALLDDGDYKGAYDFLRTGMLDYEYKDASKLNRYTSGMLAKQNGNYGYAIRYLELAEGVRDADAMLEEALAKVAPLNGTYYGDHLTYQDMGIGFYLFIKDGKASLNFESTYEEGDAVYYTWNILEKDFPNGPLFMIGSGFEEPDEDDYDYTMVSTDDDKYLVVPYETNEYDTFYSLYTKISDSTPPQK